jgi:FtsH-binding integral membrane protein
VFAALTAWDSRQLKDEYLYGAMDGAPTERPAILGALSLYLDFVNLLVRPAGSGRPRVAES